MLGQKDVGAPKPAYRTTNGGYKMFGQKRVKEKGRDPLHLWVVVDLSYGVDILYRSY